MNDPKKPARPESGERGHGLEGADPQERLRTNEVRDDGSLNPSDIAAPGHPADEHARQREQEALRAEQSNAAARSRELEQSRAQEAGGRKSASARPGNGNGDTLFTPQMLRDLRERWTRVQAEFVDEPRKAVEDADHLVAEAVKDLAETFAEVRTRLERTWDRQGQVSTEDLRQTLRRYRTFFDRVLSV